MITPPTPQQYALVAQMLQAHTQRPAPGAGGGRYLPAVQDPNAQGDWSYNQPWIPVPSTGYAMRSGHGYGGATNTVAPTASVPVDPGFDYNNWGATEPHAAPAAPVDPGFDYNNWKNTEPHSVFGAMRQALPAATRSGLHSHQQALIQRFMRNQRGK
jgi:hypothetical protein